jgi:Bacterial antitoxin of type II TA system, VapB
MPTNLAIDDRLIEEAQKLGRHRTKKDAVTAALDEYNPPPQAAGHSSALWHHRVRPQLRLQERTHQKARVNARGIIFFTVARLRFSA